MNCTGCNQPISRTYTSAYGGDTYSSCEVCEWHCEQESGEQTTIKQGLALEELVAHKKKLNWLREDLHNLRYKTETKYVMKTHDFTDNDGNKTTLVMYHVDESSWNQRLEELLSTVRDMSEALLDKEE